LLIVVEQKRRQIDGRIVDRILAAALLRLFRVVHKLVQVDPNERRRKQPKNRERRETPSHLGKSKEHRTPAFFGGYPLKFATRVGHRHQMLYEMLSHLRLVLLTDRTQKRSRLDSAAALGSNNEQSPTRIAGGEKLAHAYR